MAAERKLFGPFYDSDKPPETPEESYYLLMDIRDSVLKGLTDNEAVSLANKTGVEIVESEDPRFQQGKIIVRIRQTANPEKVIGYRLVMPQSTETFDQLINLSQQRALLENEKPEEERNNNFLKAYKIAFTSLEPTKVLYLTYIEAEKAKREEEIRESEAQRKKEILLQKRLSFLKKSWGLLQEPDKERYTDQYKEYENYLLTSTDSLLESQTKEAVEIAVKKIVSVKLNPFPQTETEKGRNERAAKDAYRLIEYLFETAEEDLHSRLNRNPFII